MQLSRDAGGRILADEKFVDPAQAQELIQLLGHDVVAIGPGQPIATPTKRGVRQDPTLRVRHDAEDCTACYRARRAAEDPYYALRRASEHLPAYLPLGSGRRLRLEPGPSLLVPPAVVAVLEEERDVTIVTESHTKYDSVRRPEGYAGADRPGPSRARVRDWIEVDGPRPATDEEIAASKAAATYAEAWRRVAAAKK